MVYLFFLLFSQLLLLQFVLFSCINSVKDRVKEFLIAILVLETFMIGVFCSLDLVIFYLFFEAGLIPMFLIIGVWGGPKKFIQLLSFFLYTLLGSVLMLSSNNSNLLVNRYNRHYSDTRNKNSKRVSKFIMASFFQLICSKNSNVARTYLVARRSC